MMFLSNADIMTKKILSEKLRVYFKQKNQGYVYLVFEDY